MADRAPTAQPGGPLFIGLMSGTSLDGVDAVLADLRSASPPGLAVRAHVHLPFDEALAGELLALNAPTSGELHRAALAGNAVARVYAEAVEALLREAGVAREQVRAIGAHGQTVRHRPGSFDGVGYTLQLNNPSLLAELTGLDVVADLRSRDVAAGGQGAPLVPAFHRAAFGRPGAARAVLNLGGIANLTLLAADGATTGFDCGPGNVLMDGWCRAHLGTPFDRDGGWAAAGQADEALLAAMLRDPYFSLPPPKSTGRDHFHLAWLHGHLSADGRRLAPVDVQATLAALTVRGCVDALRAHAPDTRELLVCGGGAFNTELMRRLAQELPGVPVRETGSVGLPALQVEAVAFAWLARAFCERRPGNLPEVTGARGPRVLGALYPGR